MHLYKLFWIEFQATILPWGLDLICKSWISFLGFLQFRHSEINLNTIWTCQKSDLGWQSEQGLSVKVGCVWTFFSNSPLLVSKQPPIIIILIWTSEWNSINEWTLAAGPQAFSLHLSEAVWISYKHFWLYTRPGGLVYSKQTTALSNPNSDLDPFLTRIYLKKLNWHLSIMLFSS